MPRRFSVAGMTLTLLLAAGLARGDIVRLRGGGQLEGKIVAETATSVTIETSLGRQTIERPRIVEIVRCESPAEELARRLAALRPDDAGGHFELALFAREKQLKRDYKRLIAKTLEIDPDHEGANRELGRVRYKDRWVTPEEKERLEAEERKAQMRAMGLVEYQGRWVTPEEKEQLEQGMVLHEGQWLPEAEARRAQGLQRYRDRWVKTVDRPLLEEHEHLVQVVGHELEFALEAHLAVISDYSAEDTERLAQLAEQGTSRLGAELGHEASDLEWLGGRKILLVVLRERAAYDAFIADFALRERKVDATWASHVKLNYGFYWWDPACTSVAYQGPRRQGAAVGHTLHNLGHLLLNRHLYNFKYMPPWLDEGFAALFEHEVHQRNDVFCVGRSGYATGDRRDRFHTRDNWIEALRNAMQASADPTVEALTRRDLNELGELDIAKAMAVVKYLRTQRREGWLALLPLLRELWPAGRPVARTQACIEVHDKAWRVAFDTDPGALEQAVRAWFLTSLKP
ncbi:MAG: hypothetical protein AB1486_20380 [Planctomycetota bacterium]